ncbi:MAG: His/Gly/Thr/Pro-type tRNA ligase C-terminal domain-containing protein, partial [Flavobacteriales bacterium]
LQLDFTLARGLDYYTGTILEVLSLEYELGSIGGGGRYDDLTSMFGQKELSGVGISFGFDRIYLIMNELNKFPDLQKASVQLCFMNFGTEEAQTAMGYLKQLRKANISAELYPKSIKMNKQMKYANQKQIPYVALLGEDEMAENKILVKHMESGTQDLLSIEQLIEKLAN